MGLPPGRHYEFNTMEELTAATDYSLTDIRLMATELHSHAISLSPPIPPEWAQYVVTAALPDHEMARVYGEWHVEATKADRTHTHPGLAILPRNDFARFFGQDAVPAALTALRDKGRPLHFTATLCTSEHRLPGAIVHGGMSALFGQEASHMLRSLEGRTYYAPAATP